MDPLSISASAVALITICVQTVRKIKKTIETIKAAKTELLGILNETNRMRLLLEQLRALTHQLGSRNNRVLLAFDDTGCRIVLEELKRLVDKLAGAEVFVGIQFLVKKSRFDALVTRLRAHEDGIRTVLLSIATESAVFTREYVQTLIDGTNVQAVSISSVFHSPADIASDPKSSSASSEKPPSYTERPIEKGELISGLSLAAESDSSQDKSISEAKVYSHKLTDEDAILLTETDLLSKSTPLHQAEADWSTGSPAVKRKEPDPHSSKAMRNSSKARKPIDSAIATSHITKTLSRTTVWHGQLSRASYDDEELELRDRLADAAYHGDWHDVRAIIRTALDQDLRSWPNCHRLGTSNMVAGWTPLHQAAFLSAPTYLVKMLIENGASRTLNTMWTHPSELPFRKMTALEIARSVGSKHLFDILSPVIRHHVPCATMHKIQEHFHDLIRDDLDGRPEYARLRLPELELLTELENPEMYFPLKSQKITMGYFYRLDGRELLVASFGVSASESHRYYRVTEHGVNGIEDAILFDMA